MVETINLSIDGQEVSAPQGSTILNAAKSIGKEIPTICYHDHCTANALCRICVVEVEDARVLSPACVAEVREGMEITTRSERVELNRRTILELLNSAVDLSESPEIQEYMRDYVANDDRFPEGQERQVPVIDDNPMYVRDYSKCILCWRCVQVCAEDAQYTYAINFEGRGFETQIGTFFDRSMPETTCVFCGQCVGVCPTGALKSRREWLFEQNKTPDEIMQLSRNQRKQRRRNGESN